MSVSLSEHWRHFIKAKVESGRFGSEAEVVEASLRLMEERDAGGAAVGVSGGAVLSARKPIWEVIEELGAEVPDGEFSKLPADGADQHDHYIYGTPKRPS